LAVVDKVIMLCGDEDKEKMEYMGELGLRSADDHAGQNQMVDVQKQLTQEWDWEKPMLEENAHFVVKVNSGDEEMEKFQFIGELDLVDGIAAQLNNNGFLMSSSKRDEQGLEDVEDSHILVTFDQWGQEMDDEKLKAIENISPPSNSSTMYSYQADPISSLTKLARWGYFGSALLEGKCKHLSSPTHLYSYCLFVV
jgi:hypothetical protein